MSGIACAGNWILDRVKIIDAWPERGELANILSETTGPGGSPFNVLIDLKRLGAPFPLKGFGCIGCDATGQEVLQICKQEGISIQGLRRIKTQLTGYTDVMTLQGKGERTFFHYRGANALFSGNHIPVRALKQSGIRIFHLGYLLLLDALDKKDPKYGTAAARLLKEIREAGIETSVDVVSEASDRFKRIVEPALPFTDHLIINEIEAGSISGIPLRLHGRLPSERKLTQTTEILLKRGVKKNVIIHMPEGVFWHPAGETPFFTPSLKIPPNKIVGTTGAGDALCSAILYGLHEGWNKKETALLACGTAAACLTAANTIDGVKPLSQIRKLCQSWARK